MKKLIAYYSLDGNTRFIAEAIASAIDADVLVLKPKKEINPKSLLKHFWGGRQVIMKQKPELLPFDKNPQDYDLLFLGTPVWAFDYAPSLRSFFQNVILKDKKIALFCCHGGMKGKTLENMKNALSGNKILGEIDFKEPLKGNREESVQKAKSWAKTLI